MSPKSAVIEVHLCIEGQQATVSGDDQRVDLQQGAVHLLEALVEPDDELDPRGDELSRQVEAEGEVAGLVGFEPKERVHRFVEYLLRGLGRDLLDIHPAGLACHDDGPVGGPVNHNSQVELLLDLHAFFDKDLLDQAALGARLGGDESHSENRLGRPLRFFGPIGELDAPALAPASGMDLRLDNHCAA